MFLLFAGLWEGPCAPSASEEEVQGWVRAARVGNAQAARRLYEAHVARVYRAVRPLCEAEAAAEDVTHDAFVDALTHLTRYAPRPGTRFVGWLLALALNRARKSRRPRAHERPSPPQELLPLQEVQGGTAEQDAAEARRTLLAALGELPERDRQVLCLRYGGELTAEEVGEALGLSAANVRKICERQRQRLLERLGKAEAA